MVWVMGREKGPGPYRHRERIMGKGAHFSPPKTPQPSLPGLSHVSPQLPLWNHPRWIINRWAVLIYHQPCTYIVEGGNKGYSRPGFITKAWHMLLIHLDNTVTSCLVSNRPTGEEFVCNPHCQALPDAHYSAHNGWIFVYNFCTQVWLSVACSPCAPLSHLHR